MGNFSNPQMDLIRRQAQSELSNYGGPTLEYGGPSDDQEDNYTGYDDDMLDFEGETSFINEENSNRNFTFTIDNTANNTDQTVLLNPSFQPSSPNKVADGNFLSVAGATLVGTGAPGLINSLLAFVKENPSKVVMFKIESTHAEQIGKTMKLIGRSPFRTLETEDIPFSFYRNENTQQDKIVTVRRPFFWDNQTEIQMVIAASARTTISFIFGAIANTAKSLRVKSDAGTRSKNRMKQRGY